MHIIVAANRKGGAGKTTIAGHLAVEIERSVSGKVAMIDCDPMAGLTGWWKARVRDTPVLVDPGRLAPIIRALAGQGITHVVVDTAPSGDEVVKEAISIASVVVVPVQPSPHDLRAVGTTVKMIEAARQQLVFVLNRVKPRTKITNEAVIALSQHGTVAPSLIHDRIDYAAAMTSGLTAPEQDPYGKAADEITALWVYINNRLTRGE